MWTVVAGGGGLSIIEIFGSRLFLMCDVPGRCSGVSKTLLCMAQWQVYCATNVSHCGLEDRCALVTEQVASSSPGSVG